MANVYDLIPDAAEVTWYGRNVIAEQDAENALSQLVPARTVDDNRFTIESLSDLGVQIASVRAFDARPKVLDREYGVTRKSGQIPPVSAEITMNEIDQIMTRANPGDALVQQAFNDVELTANAVFRRVKLMQGEAIETGKVTLDGTDDEGMHVEIDFGDSANRKETASTAWTDTANANAWDDVISAEASAADLRGEASAAMWMSQSTFSLFAQNDQVISACYLQGSYPRARRADIDRALEDEGLPPIRLFDEKVGSRRLISENVLMFMPQSPSGNTMYGVTAEVAIGTVPLTGNDRPGIITTVTVEGRPQKVVTYSNGLILPAVNPDAFYAFTRS